MVSIKAFSQDLHDVEWPTGFKPNHIQTYDGKTNSESWLEAYGIAVTTAGGDEYVMANYLPVIPNDNIRA